MVMSHLHLRRHLPDYSCRPCEGIICARIIRLFISNLFCTQTSDWHFSRCGPAQLATQNQNDVAKSEAETVFSSPARASQRKAPPMPMGDFGIQEGEEEEEEEEDRDV